MMRKIVSKEEEGKRKKTKQLVISGMLILILVASVLGYSFSRDETTTDSSDKAIYKGYEFTKTAGVWYLTKGDYVFYFLYNPIETGNISSTINLLSSYKNSPLYIYSEDDEATSEIYRNLVYYNSVAQRMQEACLQGENCSSSVPVKNCDNNFIIIRESNSTGIRQQNKCVFIEGSAENLTKLSDIFLFKITGIQ